MIKIPRCLYYSGSKPEFATAPLDEEKINWEEIRNVLFITQKFDESSFEKLKNSPKKITCDDIRLKYTPLYCGLCFFDENNVADRLDSEVRLLQYLYHNPNTTAFGKETFKYYSIDSEKKIIFETVKLFECIISKKPLPEDYPADIIKTIQDNNCLTEDGVKKELESLHKPNEKQNTNIDIDIDEKINISEKIKIIQEKLTKETKTRISIGELINNHKRGIVFIHAYNGLNIQIGDCVAEFEKSDSKAIKSAIEDIFSNSSYVKVFSLSNLLDSGIQFNQHYKKIVDKDVISEKDLKKFLHYYPKEKNKSIRMFEKQIFQKSHLNFIKQNSSHTANIKFTFQSELEIEFIDSILKNMIEKRNFFQYRVWYCKPSDPKELGFYLETDNPYSKSGLRSKILQNIRREMKSPHFKGEKSLRTNFH